MSAEEWFWAAGVLLFYTYAGYPLLVALLARLRPRFDARLLDDAELPRVTVVMAAYNEARRLVDKLANLRAQDYPARLLDVLVVSDGSSDGSEHALDGQPGVRTIVCAQRRGKAYALNRAMQDVRTEFMVLCDVRQEIEPGALRRLISDLTDPAVGVAGGELSHRPGPAGAGRSIGLYWRYERWIRQSESRLHSTVGASGALYAMRRADWRDLREGTVLDDFETPMQVARSGRRVLLDSSARFWDDVHDDPADERRRKIRTLSGNFQSFAALPWLFLPWANPLWFQFVSHKVMRLLAPYAMAVCLAASLLSNGVPYRTLAVAQLAFYALAAAGRWWPTSRSSRIVSFAHVFCDMNLAAVIALLRFLRGRIDARWEKTS
jgi:cellulose synthase/poly-beta-1,6-N-acetylglucosamine synthase-like glycosyltransferase